MEKQRRYNVTFRDNEKEVQLYDFIKEQSQIGGASNYIKLILQKEKDRIEELEGK